MEWAQRSSRDVLRFVESTQYELRRSHRAFWRAIFREFFWTTVERLFDRPICFIPDAAIRESPTRDHVRYSASSALSPRCWYRGRIVSRWGSGAIDSTDPTPRRKLAICLPITTPSVDLPSILRVARLSLLWWCDGTLHSFALPGFLWVRGGTSLQHASSGACRVRPRGQGIGVAAFSAHARPPWSRPVATRIGALRSRAVE